MNITLTYESLYAVVERSLSIIGKRSTDANGKLLFVDITLGSREKEIINDYFRQAVIDLSAETAAFVVDGGESSITLDLPINHNAALNTFIQKSCEAYCVSFALYSWFTITAPTLAEKYLADCQREMAAVTRLTHEKLEPEMVSQNYADISGTITNNKNTKTDEQNN